jgi:uncharacterized protein YhaN
MRLSRIEAVRYGRLEAVSLGDFGDGLTVVLGPNEAGKTSVTNLVRHILYGYPTKTEKERGYHSDSGKREGRLVFSSEEGEWAIERIEAPRGGLVRVEAMRGPERPNLEEKITAGIGKDTFRIVFGFGLDELAAIQSASSGDDILGKLYSAQVGMQVSPSEVRAGIEKEAQDLWAFKGQKPVLNTLKSDIEKVKSQIRELEHEAAEFAAEREQLDDMAAQLEFSRAKRAEVANSTSRLETAAERLEAAEGVVAENRDLAAEAEQRLSGLRDRLATTPVYENARAVDAELSALLDELSGYRERLLALGERDRELLALRERARSALLESGLDEDQAVVVDTGPEMTAGIERWRDQLTALSAQRDSSTREARRARSEFEAATEPGAGAVPSSTDRVPSIAMTGVGVLLAAAGVMLPQWIVAAAGGLLVALGIVLLVRAGRQVSRPAGGVAVEELRHRVSIADRDAAGDVAALESARGEWHEWLASRGFPGSTEDPVAAAAMVTALKGWRRDSSEIESKQQARDLQLDECESYRARMFALVTRILPDCPEPTLAEVPAVGGQAREALETARAAWAAREEAEREIERLTETVATVRRREAAARNDIVAMLDALEMPEADSMQVRAAAATIKSDSVEIGEEYDALLEKHTALATRLDSAGRDSTMARLRLDLVGLEQRREEALEKHAALAVAGRIMAITQEYHERTRQPEVIRRASEVFADATAGRYIRLSLPGNGEFVAYDKAAAATPTSRMSTGTVQLLYLALRIALVETLDGIGPGLPVLMDDVLVNFDPERRAGAARAIAGLAAHRQVIVFTCHPETADLLVKTAPGHTVLTMDRC